MRIFISYSRAEASVTAKKIHNYLTEIGHKEVFIDTSDIPGGVEWWNTIHENISNCDIFIILVTRFALLRPFIQKEVKLATENPNKKIIPCIPEEFVRDEELQLRLKELGLNKYHGIEYENLDELIQKIGQMIHSIEKNRKKEKRSIDKSGKIKIDKKEIDSKGTAEEQYIKKTWISKNYKKLIPITLSAIIVPLSLILLYQYIINPYDIVQLFNNAKSLYHKGYLLSKEGNEIESISYYTEAIKVYDQILDREPNNPNTLLGKADALEGQGNYTQARDLYNQVLNVSPNNIHALLGKADYLKSKDNYDDSIKVYDKVLEASYYDNPDALIGKAGIFIRQGNFTEAIDLYDQALSLSPNNVYALVGKADALYFKGDYDQALSKCDQILSIDPENTDALLVKAKILPIQGNETEALNLYDQILSIDPENTDALILKADKLQFQGNETEALNLYDQALSIDSISKNKKSYIESMKKNILRTQDNRTEAIKT